MTFTLQHSFMGESLLSCSDSKNMMVGGSTREKMWVVYLDSFQQIITAHPGHTVVCHDQVHFQPLQLIILIFMTITSVHNTNIYIRSLKA